MRNIVFACVLALGVLWLALVLALCSLDAHDQRQAQLRNAYCPFTVELQVRDI